MATGVYIPIWGLQMEEATVAAWLKEEGKAVAAGEGLAVIETYKVSGEVESPVGGVLRRRVGQVGEVLKVGQLLAVVGGTDEADAEIERVVREMPFFVDLPVTTPGGKAALPAGSRPPAEPLAAVKDKETIVLRATPLARKVARERGVDLRSVQGSGPSGRIYQRDVEAAAEKVAVVMPRRSEDRVVPLTTRRRAIIAETMKTVDIPYGALSRKVRVDALLDFRESLAEAFERKHGLKLTLTHLFFKATAAALEEVPVLNATLQGESIVIRGTVNLGMVVTPPGGGIMIPVLRDVQAKSLAQLAREWAEITERVKAGTVSLEDLSGGTFTISNVGALGIDLFTPLIHPPEAGILGISRIRQEAVVEDARIAVGRVLDLIVGADHRVFDADPIGAFLTAMDRIFQNPAELLV